MPNTANPPQFRSWIIWFIATLFVVYQLTLQLGYAAISPQLDQDIGISTAGTSLLAASFLFTYAFMQLPAGLLLDRGNVRLILSTAAGLCALATLAFSYSDSYWQLLASRAFMGATAAFAFPGAGLISRRWIKPSQFAVAMGLVDLLFGTGAVIGASGLHAMLNFMTWPQAMTWVGIGGLAIAALIALIVRGSPKGSNFTTIASRITLLEACRYLLASRQVRLGMVFYAGMCGTIFGLFGLWDIRLQQAFGFDMTQAVTLNSILFAGLGIGAILSGIIADLWRRRKPLLVIGSLGGSCCVAFILFAPAGSYLGAIITLFITGLLLGTSVIVFTSVCETLPKGYSAAAIGIVNAVGCLAGGLLQFIPSLFVDGSRIQALSVYQKTLTIFLLVMIAATVAAFLLHETRPGWENAVTPDNDRLDPLPDTANADA